MVGMAIESALNQTYRDIEVLVVDNASTDNIEEVIAGYEDPRLRLVKNPENVGQFGNFNRCIELSRGEFIHILHSDDYIEPDFTEVCIRFFDSHPQIVMTFSSALIESPEGRKSVICGENDAVIPVPEGFRRLLHLNLKIMCSSVIARRDVYTRTGKFSCFYPYSGDYYQWLKVTRVFEVGFVRNAVIHCREGEHSESHALLGKTPSGFLDLLSVMAQTISELGDSYPDFREDINTFFQLFITICISFSQIRISQRAGGYSPLVFTGLELTALGMIRPQSRKEFFDMGCLLSKIGLYYFFTVIAVLKEMRRFNQKTL
jgi:hypothetical protein